MSFQVRAAHLSLVLEGLLGKISPAMWRISTLLPGGGAAGLCFLMYFKAKLRMTVGCHNNLKTKLKPAK